MHGFTPDKEMLLYVLLSTTTTIIQTVSSTTHTLEAAGQLLIALILE